MLGIFEVTLLKNFFTLHCGIPLSNYFVLFSYLHCESLEKNMDYD